MTFIFEYARKTAYEKYQLINKESLCEKLFIFMIMRKKNWKICNRNNFLANFSNKKNYKQI